MILCTYCNLKCTRSPTFDEDDNVMFGFHIDLHEKWVDCKSCNVAYLLKGTMIEMTRLYFESKNNIYCIDLFHNKNETHIVSLPTIDKKSEILFACPYIMNNITPNNIKQKLSLLLTYI